MKTKAYLLGLISLVTVSSAGYGQVSGLLFNQHDFTPTDLFRLSEAGTQFATARVAGMGSAFTSLGADISTMHINPAGLGMYQGSDFSITPMITVSNIQSTNPGYIINGSNKKTRFGLANVGGAMNLYEGPGNLTSFTFGFGYNRLADFNTNNRMDLGFNGNSIAHAFALQLDGYTPDYLSRVKYREFDRQKWGALMAFDSGLIEECPAGSKLYEPSNAIGGGTDFRHGVNIKTQGSVGEYNISGGFNFQNKLYLGFSLGIQDYYYKQRVYYDEVYENNDGVFPVANYMEYDHYSRISGSGVNLKAGIIYRPIDPLRIGFAVHTPTWGSVTHSYEGSLYMNYEDDYNFNQTPYDDLDLDFSTPTRIMGGISYTFGNVGVVSFDYERSWYNSMRYRSDDGAFKTSFNQQIKNEFKASNVFRAGTELRPTTLLSLRAGFAYGTSPTALDLNRSAYDSAVSRDYYNVTAGIGYRIGRNAQLDIAYVFNNTNYTDYYIYHYNSEYDDVDTFYAGNPKQTLKRHSVLMTLGFRF